MKIDINYINLIIHRQNRPNSYHNSSRNLINQIPKYAYCIYICFIIFRVSFSSRKMAAALEYSGKKKLPTKWIPPKKPAYREVTN